MKLPLHIAMPFGQEHVVEWTTVHAVTLHRAAVQAAKQFFIDDSVDDIPLAFFYKHMSDRTPHSEIFLDRDSLPMALQNAEDYFVSEEMYEEAAEAKNFRKPIEYKHEK
jgi:hypothetical protein